MAGTYGLLGEKLGHSFSPQIHEQLADYHYGRGDSELVVSIREKSAKTERFTGIRPIMTDFCIC